MYWDAVRFSKQDVLDANYFGTVQHLPPDSSFCADGGHHRGLDVRFKRSTFRLERPGVRFEQSRHLLERPDNTVGSRGQALGFVYCFLICNLFYTTFAGRPEAFFWNIVLLCGLSVSLHYCTSASLPDRIMASGRTLASLS